MDTEKNRQIAIDLLGTMLDTDEIDEPTLTEMVREIALDLDALQAGGTTLHSNLLYEIITNAWENDLINAE